MATPAGRVLYRVVRRQLLASFGDDVTGRALARSMLEEAPLRTLTMGGLTLEQLDLVVDLVNGRWVAGARRLAALVAAGVAVRVRRSSGRRPRPGA